MTRIWGFRGMHYELWQARVLQEKPASFGLLMVPLLVSLSRALQRFFFFFFLLVDCSDFYVARE